MRRKPILVGSGAGVRQLAIAVFCLGVVLATPAAALGVALPGASLKITYTGSAGLHLAAHMQPCDPATQTPCDLGTATEDVDVSGFSSGFDPIPITAENKVSGAFVGQATRENMFIAGTFDAKSQYSPYYNQVLNEHCSGTFTLDPATPPAIVRIAPSSPHSGLIVAEIPPQIKAVTQDCTPDSDAFPSAEHFPQIFYAKAEITPAMLEGPRQEIPIDEAGNAYIRYPEDCTAEAQQDNSKVQSCSRTVTLTGKLVLEPVCVSARITPDGGQPRTVELVPGARPVTVNATSTIDWLNGNIMRAAPGSELSANRDCFTFTTGAPSLLKLLKGRIYGAITRGTGAAIDAIQGAITGAAGSSARDARTATHPRATFTLSVHGRDRILHVVSGGVLLTARYHHLRVLAGRTLLLLPNGGHRNTTWPASDRRLATRN